MSSPTYVMPSDGWVCFHCGERFRKPGEAEMHFGPTPASLPACTMSITERGLLIDLRKAEGELAQERLKSARFLVQLLAYKRDHDPEEALRDYDERLEQIGFPTGPPEELRE